MIEYIFYFTVPQHIEMRVHKVRKVNDDHELQLRHFVEIRAEQFRSLNVIANVELLVLTVSSIITAAHWQ